MTILQPNENVIFVVNVLYWWASVDIYIHYRCKWLYRCVVDNFFLFLWRALVLAGKAATNWAGKFTNDVKL